MNLTISLLKEGNASKGTEYKQIHQETIGSASAFPEYQFTYPISTQVYMKLYCTHVALVVL